MITYPDCRDAGASGSRSMEDVVWVAGTAFVDRTCPVYSCAGRLMILLRWRGSVPPRRAHLARELGKRGSYSATYGPPPFWQVRGPDARSRGWPLSFLPPRLGRKLGDDLCGHFSAARSAAGQGRSRRSRPPSPAGSARPRPTGPSDRRAAVPALPPRPSRQGTAGHRPEHR
jgi:hypothetical protein